MVRKELREIVIDDMRISDLPEVLKIEAASFTLPWSAPLFNNEICNPRSITKVAVLNSSSRGIGINGLNRFVVGYICADQVLDEGHILNLAVDRKFRRLGIASALVSYIINYLKNNGCKYIFLEVRISNEVAKKMYEKFNFRVLGIRKSYYVSPVEDGVVTALKLEE